MATENTTTNTNTGTSTTTEADLAKQLLSKGTRPDGTIADLGTLQAITDQAKAYREALGLAETDTAQADKLVAVSAGTDQEKDDCLVSFLDKHKEIDTIKPEVFGRLGKIAGALASAEQASTPLALDLLQVVVDLDDEQQGVANRASDLLKQPDDTLIAPGVTVGDARVLLGDFVRTEEGQQQTEQNRQNRQRRHGNKVQKQVGQAEQALNNQESVRRLRKAAQGDQALPAPAPKSKKKGDTQA